MSYRAIENVTMYMVYIIVVTFLSLLIILFGTSIGAGFVKIYTSIVMSAIVNKINIAGTFPDGSYIRIPLHVSRLVNIDSIVVVQSVDKSYIHMKSHLLSYVIETYYPTTVTFATDMVNNGNAGYSGNIFYTKLLISSDTPITIFKGTYKTNFETKAVYNFTIETISKDLPYISQEKSKFNYKYVWYIDLSPYIKDPGYLPLLKNNGVLVPLTS